MDAHYPTDDVPATPEYVVAVLQQLFRDWGQDDPPTFDTTVSSFATGWNDTLLFWWELAASLNTFFKLKTPRDDWKPALHPMRERTVRDVCVFVAARLVTRPAIRPWRHVAGDCLPAGAFLTARSLLVRDGADPDAITPSTPLEPYLGFRSSWLLELWEAVPGRMPEYREKRPWSHGAVGVWAAFAVMFVGNQLVKHGARAAGERLFGFACLLLPVAALVWLFAPARRPRHVELVGIRTFRDLAYALAGQSPRRPIQPHA